MDTFLYIYFVSIQEFIKIANAFHCLIANNSAKIRHEKTKAVHDSFWLCLTNHVETSSSEVVSRTS